MKNNPTMLAAYLEHSQMNGQYWFSRKEVIETLHISDDAFKLSSYRLSRKHALKRIRGDFFIIVPPEHRAIQSLPANWFIDAFMKHHQRPYYVSLLSAAALHGAAHQQPMVFQVITDKPMRPIVVGRVRLEFHHKKEIKSHFYQPMKTVTGTMNVSTSEMTAFDLIKYMSASGQVSHVATVLCELVESLNPDKLAELVKSNDIETAVAQRLGYLLDSLQLPIDILPLKEALNQRKVVRRLLVASSEQPVINYNAQWHIAINETVEPDEL